MIIFEDVTKIFPGGQIALSAINFKLAKKEMAFLTGHSGAGKSTMLKLITAIERPSSGKIFINNRDISRLKKNVVPFLRRGIGMIFQNHNLLEDRTVFDNIALPLVIEGYSQREIRSRVLGALDMVGLHDKEKHNPIILSGGEQQRVGIARAIVNKPTILLADEPTGNLDPKLSLDIFRLFEMLNSSGTTVLIATHDLELIKRMQYRTLTLTNGQMV